MCSYSLSISSNDRYARSPKKCDSIGSDYDDGLISYVENMQYSESEVLYESLNSFRITCVTFKYANISHSSEQLWAQVNFVRGNSSEFV